MNKEIKIEITASPRGLIDPTEKENWWAYIIQNEGEDNRRVIGRAFRTNPEAWQWAMAFVEAHKGE